jgi:hypothetical protein
MSPEGRHLDVKKPGACRASLKRRYRLCGVTPFRQMGACLSDTPMRREKRLKAEQPVQR